MGDSRNYNVAVLKIYGCWEWQGSRNNTGYPLLSPRGRVAHRSVYEDIEGPIPEGMYLDHLCRNRICVNPEHLEPVTKEENERRKSWRRRAKVTTCKKGHDMSVRFIVTPWGGKICRSCSALSLVTRPA